MAQVLSGFTTSDRRPELSERSGDEASSRAGCETDATADQEPEERPWVFAYFWAKPKVGRAGHEDGSKQTNKHNLQQNRIKKGGSCEPPFSMRLSYSAKLWYQSLQQFAAGDDPVPCVRAS